MTRASAKAGSAEEFETVEPPSVDHDDRLILRMLEPTPAKRLEAQQSFVDGVMVLRHAIRITQ